jgi:antitoxin (DNA-binding transcriptional repressor) of toxin-antitoxin stability system
MLNSLFNMKKATIREIVHGFSKLNQSLRPGETVEITAHGKPVGHYTKAQTRRIKMPNFYEESRKDGAGPEVGDALLKRLLADDEALC